MSKSNSKVGSRARILAKIFKPTPTSSCDMYDHNKGVPCCANTDAGKEEAKRTGQAICPTSGASSGDVVSGGDSHIGMTRVGGGSHFAGDGIERVKGSGGYIVRKGYWVRGVYVDPDEVDGDTRREGW